MRVAISLVIYAETDEPVEAIQKRVYNVWDKPSKLTDLVSDLFEVSVDDRTSIVYPTDDTK